MLKILAPTGEVFPYIKEVKNYLQADADANVADYMIKIDNQYAPVQVVWACDNEKIAKFLVEYAREKDFSDALTLETDGAARSVDLYNLYKASAYFVRVKAMDKKGEVLECAEGEFQTTALGPRFMKIDHICNVRDFGGYETSYGKTIVQGIAYRGGGLTPPLRDPLDTELSDEGKKYMSETLGIKTELDFRSLEESGGLTESPIPNAKHVYMSINGYDAAFRETETFRKIFGAFADKNNYPIYYHCVGGADRTGTITFILHSLLGVAERESIQNQELTSFSIYSERNTKTGESAGWFRSLYEPLMKMEGKTLQEKATSYLLSIGVTMEEIENIKAISFGEISIK